MATVRTPVIRLVSGTILGRNSSTGRIIRSWPGCKVWRKTYPDIAMYDLFQLTAKRWLTYSYGVGGNVYLSRDNGKTFVLTTTNPSRYVYGPRQANANGTLMFAAWNSDISDKTIYIKRSTDDGVTWNTVHINSSGEIFSAPFGFNYAGAGVWLYAVNANKVYRSTDDGATWNVITGVLDSPAGASTGYFYTHCNARDGFILTAAADIDFVRKKKCSISTDRGASWRLSNTSLPYADQNWAEGNCADPGGRWMYTVDLFGGYAVFYSPDYGSTWNQSNFNVVGGSNGIWNLGLFDANAGTVICTQQPAGDAAHVYLSHDWGHTWADSGKKGSPLIWNKRLILNNSPLFYISNKDLSVFRAVRANSLANASRIAICRKPEQEVYGYNY